MPHKGHLRVIGDILEAALAPRQKGVRVLRAAASGIETAVSGAEASHLHRESAMRTE